MITTALELAGRLERNEMLGLEEHVHALQRLFPAVGAAFEPVGGGGVGFCGAGSPVHRAVRLGMTEPVTPAILDQVERFYRERGEPSRVSLNPLGDRSLPALLGSRGYAITSFVNTFVRLINAEDASDWELPGPPPDIQVRPVRQEEWRLYAETSARAFGGGHSGPAPDEANLRIALPTVHRPSVTGFLALAGGEPVGAAALSVRDGLAGFFGTAVLPQYRGRGIHAALLRARIAHAARLGCDLATVSAVPGSGSERNIRRAGFHCLYSRLTLSREP